MTARVRPIEWEERDRFFRVTYDLSRETSMLRHLSFCKRDPKLRSGTHFVLEGLPPDAEDIGEIGFLSTLTAYTFPFPPMATAIGFANLFTPIRHRNRGYARTLLAGTIAHYEAKGRTLFYLLSNVGEAFYAPLGFRPLPLKYELAPECIPMLRCPPEEWEKFSAHGPFLRGLMAFVD